MPYGLKSTHCGKGHELETTDAGRRQCFPCKKANRLDWNSKHPDEVVRNSKRGNLKRLYGLTQEQVDAMLIAQNGCCAACGVQGSNPRSFAGGLFIDHCHPTGKVRGLLCNVCNPALALLENPARYAALKSYLIRYTTGDPV